MTEAEWLAAERLLPLLDHLEQVGVSARKLKLFICASVKGRLDLGPSERALWAVEVAERHVDGLASAEEVRQALGAIRRWKESVVAEPDFEGACVVRSVECAVLTAKAPPLALARDLQLYEPSPPQCDLLRHIVGNPFRPLPARAFAPEVVGLARSCAEGDLALRPLLADALEDLGEAEAAEHCREPFCVKGCHVIDWVAGRE
jgi:hypothetical protein